MSVNDLIVQGAEPLYFLDYYACSKLDVSIGAQVVESIAAGCIEAGCALIGGETAEMPGMYQDSQCSNAALSLSKSLSHSDLVHFSGFFYLIFFLGLFMFIFVAFSPRVLFVLCR